VAQKDHLKQITLLGFLAIVIIPHGFSDLVLCVGEDGHLEIEVSLQGSCFSCVSQDDHDQSEFGSLEEDHCGNCLDMAFSTSSGAQNLSRHSSPPAVPQAPVPFAERNYLEYLTPQLYPQPPPLAFPALVRIKTIRLII